MDPGKMKGRTSWKKSARARVTNAVNTILGGRPGKRAGSREEANVVIGPVIGKVTSTSARIMVELDRAAEISMTLIQIEDPKEVLRSRASRAQRSSIRGQRKWRQVRSSSNRGEEEVGSKGRFDGQVCRLEKKVVGKRPFVFEFTGLQAGSRYRVELGGCKSSLVEKSGFYTFPEKNEEWERLNVGVVSCNKIFITHMEIPMHSDLWEHLAKNIEEGNVDLMLHLGDQVYGDGDKMMDKEAANDKWSDRFKLCKKEVLKDVPKHLWNTKKEEVCEEYRGVYRETWQHPPTARCLANCPNLMIFDDHEIRDNWADLEEDWDPESLDFFIARCAWIVYLEYQRQLDRDINFKKLNKFTKDHHFHVVSDVGIMFLDVRGCRSFQRAKDDEFPYLGSSQWKDIDAALSAKNLFSDVRVLLVCSPAPLVFLEPHITDAAAKNVPRLADFRGHWSADIHRKEQTRMIETLWKWKRSDRREVMILGGDVHCGGHSHILKDDQVLFNQLTTSAIANRPLPKAVYYFMRAAGRLGDLGNDYKFIHHHWTRSRNYGLMNIRGYRRQDDENVEIQSKLVIGKFMGGIIQGEVVRNSSRFAVKCGCFEAGGL